MGSIHITSLGCPKNFVDSEVMLGILEGDGWEIALTAEDADVLLINTCGFIQPAVEEGIDEILNLARIKEEHPDKKLVVTGCMVQRYRDKLQDELPEIDLLVGTEGVKDIGKILQGFLGQESGRQMHLPDRFIMDSSMPRKLATPKFRAWMKITEGCDNRCSYCMIPSIRGGLRSRDIDDLALEGVALEQQGVKELTLIAQDLTAFGTEKGYESQLMALLDRLLERTSIPWIRLLYLYPSEVILALLESLAREERIVPYMDIPLQHISDKVLKRMNRRYSSSGVKGLINQAREVVPDIALRTTFLLGFPGETESDVYEVEKFLKTMKLNHVGVFPYANEEGCPSEFFPDQLPEDEKQARVDHILSVQSSISAEIQKRYVGSVQPVLVEGVSQETDLLLEGRTRYQAPEIDGCVYINDGVANPGDIVNVRIDESQIYDLVGAIV